MSDTGTSTRRFPRAARAGISAACLLGLAGQGILLLHLLVPAPWVFALFMSAGNGCLALAVLLYVAVVVSDLRRRRAL